MRARSVVFAFCAACVAPRPPPAPPRTTHLGLELSGFALRNGLRVVLVRDPRAAEIQVTMRYQIGSVDDPPDHPGMAHLVEHLMYQQVLGAESVFAHLERVASYFNGMTTLDATTFVARAPVAHLEELLSIEAVRVGSRCVSINESAFERERGVVLNELRQRDEPTEILSAVRRGLYPDGHPYRRATIGTEDTVGSITRDQACAFADAHYGPSNAVLVISGDITTAQIDVALGKFLARVPRRTVVLPAPVPDVPDGTWHAEVAAPIDESALLFAWRLPSEPLLRAEIIAVANVARGLVDAQVAGRVAIINELGDGRAPMLGMVVVPGEGESTDDAIAGVKRGLDGVPAGLAALGTGPLGEMAFDEIQQGAIYSLFARLEDGSDRDIRLASDVLAGREPSAALAAEFKGLRELTRDETAAAARDHLSFDGASVVLLRAENGTKRGHRAELVQAIHDLGERRDPRDPAEAHQPARTVVPPGFNGFTTRVLPNGLKLVLLPLTSVPTVDIRLVFGVGTADEPAFARGVALVAAHTLNWDYRYLNDLLAFAAAGGTRGVDVTPDRTTFSARGLDMHIDVLLAGLRRWIHDGKRDGDVASIVATLRHQLAKTADTDAVSEAWRTGLYGVRHPYVAAGRLQQISERLTSEDVDGFRKGHYTPDNATLVIAGHFDAALVDRWVDFLFADWAGHRETRTQPLAAPAPVSLAQVAETEQVELAISLPAAAERRASRLVAAAMLDDIAGDVRQQLGASYGLHVQLVEARLATRYAIGGRIERARAREAVELIRTRIAQLRSDPDAAARAFVAARDRVQARLVSVVGSAASLADRVDLDVAMERVPMTDVGTSVLVAQLTIESMTEALAELDLTRAAVWLRGPEREIVAAFGALGRTPEYVHADPEERAPTPAPTVAAREPEIDLSLVEPALTEQQPRRFLRFTLAPGYSTASIDGTDMTGTTIAGGVAYRFDRHSSAGIYASGGYVSGQYQSGGFFQPLHPVSLVPIDLMATIEATAFDRLWGELLVGLRIDRVDDAGVTWNVGFGLGLQAGLDILSLGPHRLGIVGRVLSSVGTDYSVFTIGLAYRQ